MPKKHPTKTAGARIPLYIFLSLFCFYCLLLSTRFDGYERAFYATARTAVTIHEFHMGDAGMTSMYIIDGKRYFIYVLQSILEIPLVASGMVLDSVFAKIGFNPQFEFFFPKSISAIFTALTGVLVYLFSLSLYRREKLAITLALIYGLTTLAVPYAQIGMDPILTFLAFWGFYLVKRSAETGSGRNFILTGIVFGLAMGTKTYAFVLYPFAAFYLYLLHKNNRVNGIWAKVAFAAAGGLIGLLPYFWYNYHMFNDIIAAKERAAFASEIFTAPGPLLVIRNIYAFFFSAGKSFFLYSPPLVLIFWGARSFFGKARAEAWLVFSFSISLLLFFSVMDIPIYWTDESWGARYFLIVVPLLVMTLGGVVEAVWASGLLKRVNFYILLVFGFLIQLPGSLVYYAHQTNILIANNLYSLQNIIYIPELSHIPINIFLIWASLMNRFTGTFPTYYYWPRSTVYYKVKFDPIPVTIDPNFDYITAWWYQTLSYEYLDSVSFYLVILVVLALFSGFVYFGLAGWRLAKRAEGNLH